MIPQVTLADSHKSYKKECRQTRKYKWYREEVYLKIAGGFMAFMMKKVFEGHDVKLGSGDTLGAIGVRGSRVQPRIDEEGNLKGLAPDWGTTNKLWRENEQARENRTIIFYTNDHTGGIRYNLVWYKGRMRWQNKLLYMLTFSKTNRRMLSEHILNGREYHVRLTRQL